LIHKKWKFIGSFLQFNKKWKETFCRLFNVASDSIVTFDPLIQLTTLSEEFYKLVLEILHLYSNGKLKEEKPVKNKAKDLNIVPFLLLQNN
jgi:hypothetical protein